MNGFIEWLERLNQKDTRVRAVLRRSLSFYPGQFPAAFPYVEPFLTDKDQGWRREAHYLVAGLWAMHWREGRSDKPVMLAQACATHDGEQRRKLSAEDSKKLTAMERRFVALLDADSDQLPYRLRQMVALLAEQSIDFAKLLTDLLFWNAEGKRTRNTWARDYYRNLSQNQSEESETTITEKKHEDLN